MIYKNIRYGELWGPLPQDILVLGSIHQMQRENVPVTDN